MTEPKKKRRASDANPRPFIDRVTTIAAVVTAVVAVSTTQGYVRSIDAKAVGLQASVAVIAERQDEQEARQDELEDRQLHLEDKLEKASREIRYLSRIRDDLIDAIRRLGIEAPSA